MHSQYISKLLERQYETNAKYTCYMSGCKWILKKTEYKRWISHHQQEDPWQNDGEDADNQNYP